MYIAKMILHDKNLYSVTLESEGLGNKTIKKIH
jgi:hypothetical protein